MAISWISIDICSPRKKKACSEWGIVPIYLRVDRLALVAGFGLPVVDAHAILSGEPFINKQVVAISRLRGKLVAAFVFGVSRVAFHPNELHVVRLFCRQQALP